MKNANEIIAESFKSLPEPAMAKNGDTWKTCFCISSDNYFSFGSAKVEVFFIAAKFCYDRRRKNVFDILSVETQSDPAFSFISIFVIGGG